MEELIKRLTAIYDKYTAMPNIHKEVAEETKKIAMQFALYTHSEECKIYTESLPKNEFGMNNFSGEHLFNKFIKEYYGR